MPDGAAAVVMSDERGDAWGQAVREANNRNQVSNDRKKQFWTQARSLAQLDRPGQSGQQYAAVHRDLKRTADRYNEASPLGNRTTIYIKNNQTFIEICR